jgi:hypothetical protein
LGVIFKDLEFALTGNKGASKIKWEENIGKQLLETIYAAKVLSSYQEAVGTDIFPIPDLKTTLNEGKFKFTKKDSSLFAHAKNLEKKHHT